MSIETRTLSGKNPKLIIDLTKLFGQRVPDSEVFREAVGQAIIDEIRKNAKDSKDRKGRTFTGRKAKYSKAYKESTEFKAAGKSNKVNMTLTGDMLAFMDIVKQRRDAIIIGFDGREEQLKAYGHITGDPRGPKVKRDFFGLPVKSYEKIAKKFRIPEEEPTTQEISALGQLFTLRDLFGES